MWRELRATNRDTHCPWDGIPGDDNPTVHTYVQSHAPLDRLGQEAECYAEGQHSNMQDHTLLGCAGDETGNGYQISVRFSVLPEGVLEEDGTLLHCRHQPLPTFGDGPQVPGDVDEHLDSPIHKSTALHFGSVPGPLGSGGGRRTVKMEQLLMTAALTAKNCTQKTLHKATRLLAPSRT